MKKGQKLKCLVAEGSYLTVGNIYEITAAKGDKSTALGAYGFEICGKDGFNIIDDEGEVLLQAGLIGGHGIFEVIS